MTVPVPFYLRVLTQGYEPLMNSLYDMARFVPGLKYASAEGFLAQNLRQNAIMPELEKLLSFQIHMLSRDDWLQWREREEVEGP